MNLKQRLMKMLGLVVQSRRANLNLFNVFYILLFLIPLPACTADAIYQKLPITKPFALHQANAKAEIYFKVTKEDDYAYTLKFNYANKKDIDSVLALMEQNEKSVRGHNDGEPIYVSLEVFKVEGGKEYMQTQYGTESLPLSSWGSGSYDKQIYKESLLPGHYRATLISNKDTLAFNTIKVDFSVSLAHRPK